MPCAVCHRDARNIAAAALELDEADRAVLGRRSGSDVDQVCSVRRKLALQRFVCVRLGASLRSKSKAKTHAAPVSSSASTPQPPLHPPARTGSSSAPSRCRAPAAAPRSHRGTCGGSYFKHKSGVDARVWRYLASMNASLMASTPAAGVNIVTCDHQRATR